MFQRNCSCREVFGSAVGKSFPGGRSPRKLQLGEIVAATLLGPCPIRPSPATSRKMCCGTPARPFDSTSERGKSVHVGRTVFVGDVHGCAAELQELLDHVAFCETDALVFVGGFGRPRSRQRRRPEHFSSDQGARRFGQPRGAFARGFRSPRVGAAGTTLGARSLPSVASTRRCRLAFVGRVTPAHRLDRTQRARRARRRGSGCSVRTTRPVDVDAHSNAQR